MTNTNFLSSECQTATLDCGLRVVHRKSASPVMYCGFMVDCGTRHEASPQEFGMAHFVEHILFKGTRKLDSWHINNCMESVGGELNAFTTKEETTYYAIGLNHDFRRACQLLSDLVCHATAPQAELEKEQEVVIDEIMSYRDTPSELIFDEFENQLFVGQPLGHNILGSEQTVRTFHHQRCMDFIRQHYTPERMVFFHQGNTPFTRVLSTIDRCFYPDGHDIGDNEVLVADYTPTPAEPCVAGQQSHFQSHVLLGARTFPIGHPDAAALALLNNILGGPGMNSRLGLELRERRGLVYTVESNISNYTDAGYLGIYFGCDHHDTDRCLRLCHNQLEHFRTKLLTSRQCLNAQRQLCGQIGIGAANLENAAIAMAKNILRLGHVESVENIRQRIMSVTPEDIRRVANTVLCPDMLKTVIIQ